MSKKNIGITLKVMKHHDYHEVITCIDIQWIKFLLSLNFIPLLIPLVPTNDLSDILKKLKLDGIILSGGNTLADYSNDSSEDYVYPDRDLFEIEILKIAIKDKIPVLGICRGLQLINTFFGGKLTKFDDHVGKKQKILSCGKTNLMFPSQVTCYHRYTVCKKSLGTDLIPLAIDNNNNIQALKHSSNKILAIMWHPEREKPTHDCDNVLIKKYFS